MKPPLLEIKALQKRFGALTATDRVDLDIKAGEIHALIGPNGAGKTTLVNQIMGETQPDAGEIYFDGYPITGLPIHRRTALGIGRTFQITNIFKNFEVIQNIALAVQAISGHSFRFWRPVGREIRLIDAALHLLEQVGLTEYAHTKAAELAYGDQRKVGIAMAMAANPRLLIMEFIPGSSRFSARLADRISVLVYGQIIATGTPSQIRGHAGVREAYLGEE